MFDTAISKVVRQALTDAKHYSAALWNERSDFKIVVHVTMVLKTLPYLEKCHFRPPKNETKIQ